jgi:transposase
MSEETRRGGRFSSKRKLEAVLRILRGEDLDLVSRELGVTAARLSAWRDDFLAGGEAILKSRQPSAQDEELLRLKRLVGDLTMRLELSREKIRRMESGESLARRRSRK